MSEPFTKTQPQNVTLRLSLGKKYELTYVSMQFCSARPDSMSIFKSMDHGKTWKPFQVSSSYIHYVDHQHPTFLRQYYSSQCKDIYSKSPRGVITRANEQEAVCTDAYSKIDPMSGARVAFRYSLRHHQHNVTLASCLAAHWKEDRARTILTIHPSCRTGLLPPTLRLFSTVSILWR